MEKQKIFLLVIAAGAIFILIQQGSQTNLNRFTTSFNQHLDDNQKLKQSSHNNITQKTSDVETKSLPFWSYSLIANELSKTLNDIKSYKKRKKEESMRRFNFIDRFAIYDGDQQAHVLIMAYFRSGSSFVGDLLQQNWKTFYSFEPLHYMTRQTRIGQQNITEATKLINSIYSCDFDNSSYTNWAKNNSFLFRWNHFLWNVCKFRSVSLCFDENFLSQVCRRSKYNIIKTVRLRIKDLESLIKQMSTSNLKVIYLVRDPRGIYNSRKSMEWCNEDECSNLTNICAEMRQDLLDYDRLKLLLGDNLITIRYEDISLDPMTQAKQLFNSINIDFSPSVSRFLRTHTKAHKRKGPKNDPYSTYRTNSSLTAMQWTKELNNTELEFAQEVCEDVLERLNYTNINVYHTTTTQ